MGFKHQTKGPLKRAEKYSALGLIKHALTGHKHWSKVWRSPEPKTQYDVIIIGGGGQGLATAYYLASQHGMTNVAVLEAGWLGGGNTGRNTQVVRSNYFYPASTDFFEHSMQLYENLGKELNYNIMFSQRGVLNLAHSRHDLEQMRRWANSIELQGVDSEMVTSEQIKTMIPDINMSSKARYPIVGGFIQNRAGIVRHDAVAWGYARQADALGVDIIQNCRVMGIRRSGNRVVGVETTQGFIAGERIASTVAGHSSTIADMVDLRLPLRSMALQAMVSEPLKPFLDTVFLSPVVHAYISQSDRGEVVMGGGLDMYNSYGQRGNIATTESVLAAVKELLPCMSRVKLMRQWAGIVDVCPDSSPIIGKTPIEGFYISTGWGTGGFKGIPAGGETLAHTIAHDQQHPLIKPFTLERFATGALVDEAGAAGIAH
jgi:sarcosine oxidase, subunit beta